MVRIMIFLFIFPMHFTHIDFMNYFYQQQYPDLQKDRQFRKLNAKKEDRLVKVLRDSKVQLLSIYDILVGDILLVEPGDVIAVDGVLLSGTGIKCDESSATGETDAVKKGAEKDPFFVSGSKVLEGVGRYLVTGVGEKSFFGTTMMGE